MMCMCCLLFQTCPCCYFHDILGKKNYAVNSSELWESCFQDHFALEKDLPVCNFHMFFWLKWGFRHIDGTLQHIHPMLFWLKWGFWHIDGTLQHIYFYVFGFIFLSELLYVLEVQTTLTFFAHDLSLNLAVDLLRMGTMLLLRKIWSIYYIF